MFSSPAFSSSQSLSSLSVSLLSSSYSSHLSLFCLIFYYFLKVLLPSALPPISALFNSPITTCIIKIKHAWSWYATAKTWPNLKWRLWRQHFIQTHQLMPLGQGLGYIFEIIHSLRELFKILMFHFKSVAFNSIHVV